MIKLRRDQMVDLGQVQVDCLKPVSSTPMPYRGYRTIWVESPMERIRIDIDPIGRIAVGKPERVTIGVFASPFVIADQSKESKRIRRFELP